MTTTAQEEEAEFKEVSLIFNARRAEPLSFTQIPELQRVIPNNHWQEFAEKAAETVKVRHYFMFWHCETCLAGGLVKDMTALCEETNKKIGQKTNKFVGPNVTLTFLRNPGQIGPSLTTTYYGGYRSSTDTTVLWKEPDKYAVLVKYRRAAFFKTAENK